MTTTIQVSAEFGGEDAAKAVLPHFRALKSVLEKKPFEGFPLPELAFILRVDGEVTAYGPSGAEHINFDKKGQYVSVDIGIARDDIAHGDTHLAALVAWAIVSSVDMLMKRGNVRLKGANWGAVQIALQAFTDAYQAQFGKRPERG